jgi:hypothetical protein
LKAAEVYSMGGNKDRAIEVLKSISAGPPSDIRGKARKLLGELTSGPAKAGGAS